MICILISEIQLVKKVSLIFEFLTIAVLRPVVKIKWENISLFIFLSFVNEARRKSYCIKIVRLQLCWMIKFNGWVQLENWNFIVFQFLVSLMEFLIKQMLHLRSVMDWNNVSPRYLLAMAVWINSIYSQVTLWRINSRGLGKKSYHQLCFDGNKYLFGFIKKFSVLGNVCKCLQVGM